MERGRRLASLVKGWQLFRSSRESLRRLGDERKDRCESNDNSDKTWRKLARRLRPQQVCLFLFQETRRG